MPELPEVETIVNNLKPNLTNLIITELDIRTTLLRTKIDILKLAEIKGQSILSTYRRAKWPALVLSNGYLWLHLGMTGQILLSSDPMRLDKHVHLVLTLSNDTYLIYRDPRKFGTIAFTHSNIPPAKNLGPEPLDESFNGAVLHTNLSKTKRPLKTALMDSTIVAGIGNIYASEILFKSKIHPSTPSSSITLLQCTNLVKNIKNILNIAIKNGGSTLRDYRQPDGSSGHAQDMHEVYNRTNLPCLVCNTPISEAKYAGRSTFWCNKCQI